MFEPVLRLTVATTRGEAIDIPEFRSVGVPRVGEQVHLGQHPVYETHPELEGQVLLVVTVTWEYEPSLGALIPLVTCDCQGHIDLPERRQMLLKSEGWQQEQPK